MAIAVLDKQGTTLNIRITENALDAARTPQMDKNMAPYLVDTQHIVMDFSQVEYVSSSGLRMLLWLAKKMEKCGGKLEVSHVSENVLDIFETTGFLAFVHVIGG